MERNLFERFTVTLAQQSASHKLQIPKYFPNKTILKNAQDT
jgi:hypothetical protein